MGKPDVASWSLVVLVVVCLELYGYVAVEATRLGRSLGDHQPDMDKNYPGEDAKEADTRLDLTAGGYGHYGGGGGSGSGSGFGSGSRDGPKYGYGTGGGGGGGGGNIGGGYGPGGGFDGGAGGGSFGAGGRYGSGGGQNGGWDGGSYGAGGGGGGGYGPGHGWHWVSGSEYGSKADAEEAEYGVNSLESWTTADTGKDMAAGPEQP